VSPGVVARPQALARLPSPLLDNPQQLSQQAESEIAQAFRALRESGEAATAAQTAAELLESNPDLVAATVLEAEARIADGALEGARSLLAGVLQRFPEYTSARIASGIAAEGLGDVVGAYAAFRRAADTSGEAAREAERLRDRALEVLHARIGDALARQHLDEARRQVATLREWAPNSLATYEAMQQVSKASGDLDGELVALRGLNRLDPGDATIAARRASLEVRVGDASLGLEMLRKLVASHPQSSELAHELAQAKFRWRLQLVPGPIRRLADSPQLSRGEYATLLYWLTPAVRYGQPQQAVVATDILEDPHRQEIVRVVNLGLLSINPTLHVFRPDKPITRAQVLRSLLKLLALADRPVACLGPNPKAVGATRDLDSLCTTASQCELLPDAGSCLPDASVDGATALEMIRLAQVAEGSK